MKEQRLRDTVAEWRRTADIWDTAVKAGQYWVPKRVSVERPPERAKASIQNWINWLRYCAREIEGALDDEESSPRAIPTPPQEEKE